MRIGPLLIVLAVAGPAHADDELSLELGYLRNRVAVTDKTAIDGQAIRFTVKLSRGEHVHFGAEAEEGLLEGTTTLPNGAVARLAPGAETQTPSTSIGPESPLEGNTLALKLFAGVHSDLRRRVVISSDLALGFRDTWVSSDLGTDVAGRKEAMLLEMRTRADVRVSPRSTVGAVATTNLIDRRDVSLGLVFALHFAH